MREDAAKDQGVLLCDDEMQAFRDKRVLKKAEVRAREGGEIG